SATRKLSRKLKNTLFMRGMRTTPSRDSMLITEPWKKPTVAMVTAVATVTLLLAVLWSVGRCRAEGCHAHFQKQPLPLSL
ncbi:hypothetical protein NHX12_003658, partial [Muraenolepis orangiensis]